MRLLLVICAIAIIAIASVQALDTNAANWIRVPGGATIHKSCLHEVPSGTVIDASNTPACLEVSPSENVQLYAIDTHWTTTNVSMKTFDASFNVPGNPPKKNGQINFFWPGFKSNQPTMGLPVVQPVLQFEHNTWAIRSWYVYGDVGEAYASTALPVKPGDIIGSSMKFSDAAQEWTISCWIAKSPQYNTTLKVTKHKTHDTDFKVAMLVLETVMDPNHCELLPASPSSITFTGVKVNGGATIPWVPRTGSNDCNQQVAKIAGDQVTFSWTN